MEQMPYIKSRYLERHVYLNEVMHLNDDNLALLATEVNGIETDTAFYLREQERRGEVMGHTIGYERLLKTASRFAYAIEAEQNKRQRQQSILQILNEVKEVRAERDALKAQLDRLTVRRI